MNGLALIMEISAAGIHISVSEPHLILSPKKAITENLSVRVQKSKAEIVIALREIETALGEDWAEISAHPEQLKAAADLLRIEQIRKRGEVPSHYTSKTVCAGCGPVPIFEGPPARVLGCPWCFNRYEGLPMPSVSKDK